MKKCIVLVGGICSGKSTIAKALEAEGFNRIVTYTTRKPRDGEVDGVDYHFISTHEFKKRLSNGFFAETSLRFDQYHKPCLYGSAVCDYDTGKVIVLDHRGVEALRVDAFVVLLDLPIIVLKNRVVSRGDIITSNVLDERIIQDQFHFSIMTITRPPNLIIKRQITLEKTVTRILKAYSTSINEYYNFEGGK